MNVVHKSVALALKEVYPGRDDFPDEREMEGACREWKRCLTVVCRALGVPPANTFAFQRAAGLEIYD